MGIVEIVLRLMGRRRDNSIKRWGDLFGSREKMQRSSLYQELQYHLICQSVVYARDELFHTNGGDGDDDAQV